MKYALIILGFIMLVSVPFADSIGEDGGNSLCNPKDYRLAGGTWIEQDGGCWYLHSDAEFDAPTDVCIDCHNGFRAEWRFWGC